MRIRGGRSLVVFGLVVAAVLGLGVAQVVSTAPEDGQGDAADGDAGARTRKQQELARVRVSETGSPTGAAPGDDAGADEDRGARAPRLRARAEDSTANPAAGENVAARARPTSAGVAGVAPAPANADGALGADEGQTSGENAAHGPIGAGRRGPSGRAALRQPPGTLTIAVHAAESGAPLRDVEITILVDGGKPEVVVADALGRVVLRLDPGSTAEVRAHAVGRVVQRRTGLTVAPEMDTPVAFDLVRGVVVRGVVTRGEGVPVAGAHVRAWTDDDWRSVMPLDEERFPLADVVTDRAGRYVVDAMPRATASVLLVEAPGRASDLTVVAAEPDPDYVVRHDVELAPGVTLVGSVVAPVPGSQGDVVAVAGARVLAFLPIDVKLERKWRYWLLGSFTDEQIVEHAFLDAIDRNSRGYGWNFPLLRPCRATTDADGRFEIAGCPTGTKFRLLAIGEGRGRSVPSAEVEAPLGVMPGVSASGGPTLTLRGRQAVEFEVRTHTGQPTRDVEVARTWPWELWTAAALANGRLGTPLLDVGVHRIQIGAKGQATNHYACIVDPAAVGPARQVVMLRDGFTVSGKVVDDVGAPVAGAKVTDGRREIACASDGSYSFEGLDFRWSDYLGASAPGHLDKWVRVAPKDAASVDIALVREAVVTATLRCAAQTDGSGAPTWRRILVSDARWMGIQDRPRAWRALPDLLDWGDGETRVDHLPAGTFPLAFVVPGMEVAVRNVTTRAGESTDLGAIDLVAARRIEGIVRDATGAPVEDVEVAVVLDHDGHRQSAAAASAAALAAHLPQRVVVTGADGRFQVDLVVGGARSLVKARGPGGWAGTAVIPDAPEAAEGEEPVVVVLDPVVVRSGRIVGASWSEGLTAFWCNAEGSVLARCHVAKDGTFEAAVPGAPVRVDVTVPLSGRTGSATIDPAADPSVPVEVQLR